MRAQVVSRPEPDLAILTMGRRDVSFDQGLPRPLELPDSAVFKLNDQHAFVKLGPSDRSRARVGDWLRFGISHPCTVFDKWQLIPVLDADHRVVVFDHGCTGMRGIVAFDRGTAGELAQHRAGLVRQADDRGVRVETVTTEAEGDVARYAALLATGTFAARYLRVGLLEGD